MKKFPDALDTAAITTVYVVKYSSPILSVFHYLDGYWQFSGAEENLPDEDFMILRLDEIIAIDPSVLEVSDMPLGYSASRKTPVSQWVILHENLE